MSIGLNPEKEDISQSGAEREFVLPVLPLRDLVLYPHMVVPLYVGREKSIEALERASNENNRLFLVSQKKSAVEEPSTEDLFDVGVVASIVQMLKQEDGTIKVLVEGLQRAKMLEYQETESCLMANIKVLQDTQPVSELKVETKTDILMRSALASFENLVKVNRKIPAELITSLAQIIEPGRLADNIAAHLTGQINSRQRLLECVDVVARLELLQEILAEEEDIWQVEEDLKSEVQKRISETQKLYYLREKQGALTDIIQKIEGGESGDEFEQLRDQILSCKMPDEVEKKALSELEKFKKMPSMSAEATVCRNYLDSLVKVPWHKCSKVKTDLKKAQDQLNEDHHGLEEIKERILEFMAVQGRVKKLKGPILCLVGPPGVGKTSLGQSIAKATGRKFIRFALGGVHDEAEIRGHRRTYVGAMPGKLMQLLTRSGVKNPLCMLDEVDKMSSDFRGDPAAALLEVLDQEQNHAFTDHYLEVPYDLSDVMFIATSNSLNIPPPLLDRMEVIRIAGYTEEEKMCIAKRYLLPKQMSNCGLVASELSISDTTLKEIIRSYTREAGVRSLERQVAKMLRKIVKKQALSGKKAKKGDKIKAKPVSVTIRQLQSYLGVPTYRFGTVDLVDRVGQVNGLAYTQSGGDLLSIESQIMPGKGRFHQTGSLGDVMQESIQAAMTVVRSRTAQLNLGSDFFQTNDFHVHVPEGATPKDGPSAGVGMAVSLLSTITGIAVRSDVAMTGEITLRGEVLPIGGLKEKLLAALRGGIKHVIIPKDNERELKELPDQITKGLAVHPVQWVDEAFHLALVSMPKPWTFSKGDDNALLIGHIAAQNNSEPTNREKQ